MSANPEVIPAQQWPVLPKSTDIVVKCAPLEQTAAKAEDMLAELQALPVTEESAAKLADLRTFCVRAQKGIDARRLEYTEPARTFQTELNAEVKRYTDRIDSVSKKAAATLLKHEQEKRSAEAERQRQERAKAEAEALEAAQKLQDQGNAKAAERVLDVAASAPRPAPKPTETRGEVTGKRVGIRETWSGEVATLNDLLRAVIDGKVSAEGISVSQAWLNRLAAAHRKEETVHGVRVKRTESLA